MVRGQFKRSSKTKIGDNLGEEGYHNDDPSAILPNCIPIIYKDNIEDHHFIIRQLKKYTIAYKSVTPWV